jgi:hypothetical protein
MPALRELQHAFARALLAPGDADVESWVIADAIPAADRTAIYRNTFHGVAVAALRITYPVVDRLVGAEFFEGAARLYLAEQPPLSAYLNDYGASFGDFLADFGPVAGLRYLPDVARLEWAVAASANAPDAAALDPASLARWPPETLERLRLVPHPSLRIVELATSADAIWCAITAGEEDALAGIELASERFAVVVHRADRGVVIRRLTADERAVTEALMIGQPIGDALRLAPEEVATVLLAEHLAGGRFTHAETENAG